MRLAGAARRGASRSVDSLTPFWQGGELGRARSLRHVRVRLQRPPGPAPHPDATRSSSAIRCARTTRPTAATCCRARTRRSRACPPSTRAAASSISEDDVEQVTLNLGPSHPATHGTLRVQALLDGETHRRTRETEIGYLHRCFEKMSRDAHLPAGHPVHRPAQLLSAFINNVGYAWRSRSCSARGAAARAVRIRTDPLEFMRITDHLVCIGANLVDMGALTNFWYLVPAARRDLRAGRGLLRRAASPCRYGRVGGVAQDVPDNFVEHAQRVLRTRIPEVHRRRRPAGDQERDLPAAHARRRRGDAQNAINCGWTGPCLRATGVHYDVRTATTRTSATRRSTSTCRCAPTGDTFARYMVRMEEMRAEPDASSTSARSRPRRRPDIVDDYRVALPEGTRSTTNIESLIYHFKLIMHGFTPPVGEVYSVHRIAERRAGLLRGPTDGQAVPAALRAPASTCSGPSTR